MRLIGAIILLVLLAMLPVGHASAQQTTAIVVAACGTPPTTYPAGVPLPLTQDTTGKLCDSGGGGGGGSNASVGATGAAVPASATYGGMSVGGNLTGFTGTGSNLNVQCANCSGSGVSATDETAFTAGASVFAPTGGFYQTTATSNPLTTGQQGAAQLTINRALHSNLRNAVGVEVGTSTTPLQVGAPSGAYASGAFASGSLAAGSGTDGWNVTEGTKADTAWVSGSGSMIAILKAISGNTGGAIPAGANVIGAVTQSGTWTVAVSGNPAVNLAQVNGVTTLTGAGATGTGAQRETVAQDTTTVAGSAPGTAGTPSTNVVSVQGVSGGTAVPISYGAYPATAVPLTASATGTTAAVTATLTNVSTHTTYICGFSIRANATAAVTVNATVTGTVTATMNYSEWVAPVASGIGVVEQVFSPCIPASAVSTSIAVVSGAAGSGGVTSVSAWGFSI